MNKIKLLCSTLTVISFFFSCNSNLEEFGIEKELLNYNESERIVLNMLYNFSNEGTISTKSATYSYLIITDIDSQKYKFNFNPIEIQTRSSEDETEVTLYTINFKKGNKNGFSIISSDERCQYVYAYTENGCIDDTSKIKPLKKVINDIPKILEKDLYKFYTNQTTNLVTKADQILYLNVPNIMKSAWSQDIPYNNNFPTMNDGCKAYAGCVTIACAQVLAMLNPSALSSFNLSELANIEGSISIYDYWANTTADFVYYLANNCLNSSYGCDHTGGTGSNIQDICGELGNWGITYYYREADLDMNKLASSLSIGWPVIASGVQEEGNKSGHAWVYSGIRADVTGSRGDYTVSAFFSIYCNWGYGSIGDGWYRLYEQYPTETYPYSGDNAHIYFHLHTPNPNFDGGYAYL